MNKTLLSTIALAAISLVTYAENIGETITSNGLKYKVTSATTVEVQEETGEADAYDIPATVTGADNKEYTVNAIGENAFYYSHAKSVKLPETIEVIKKAAFKSSAVAEINLPGNLKSIGSYAFNGAAITSIEIPASVERINDHAFFGSTSKRTLKSVKFNEGLKYIGQAAFWAHGFTSVEIPASVDTIASTAFCGGYQFSENKTLTTVTFKEGVKFIGSAAFGYNQVLNDITLPNSLVEVGKELFINNIGMTSINIPASLETIGDCFIAGTNVSNITLDAANKYFVKQNNVIYTKGYTVLQLAPVKGITTLTVNNKCIGIAGGAFWGSEIQSIMLPDGLVAIGYGAFLGSQLNKINWPHKLIWIGEQAFANTQFTTLTMPESFPAINDGAFASCMKLTTLTIPSGIKEIYNHAFHNCKNLTTVVAEGSTAPTLMEAYESYDEAFYGIASSATITVPKGAKSSYSEQGYDNYFSIKESEAGTLGVVSTDKADGATLGQYAAFSIKITFDEPVEVLKENPDVIVRVGTGGSQNPVYSLSSKIVEPEGEWTVTKENATTVHVWGSDYDGYTSAFLPEDDIHYFIIPSGIVKGTTTGEKNEQIIVRLYKTAPTAIGNLYEGTATVVNNGEVVARYNVSGQKISKEQQGMQIVKFADGTSRKVMVK